MPSVIEHYENVLAGHYSWLFGGLEAKIEENRKFFDTHGIKPGKNRVAVDLGCGSGFQSIPLAQLGFRVVAVDLSPTLLSELVANKADLPIETIQDDLVQFLVQYLRMLRCVTFFSTPSRIFWRRSLLMRLCFRGICRTTQMSNRPSK